MKTALHELDKVDADHAIVRQRGGAELPTAILKRIWCPFLRKWDWIAVTIYPAHHMDQRNGLHCIGMDLSCLKEVVKFIKHLNKMDEQNKETTRGDGKLHTL